MKNLKEAIVDNDEILNVVNDTNMVITEDWYNNDSVKYLEKDYLDEIVKYCETLNIYLSEIDPKTLNTQFPDKKWNYLTKTLAYAYEYFNCIDDHKKSVDNLGKEAFFSELKNKCPDDDETQRTKEFINCLISKMEKK